MKYYYLTVTLLVILSLYIISKGMEDKKRVFVHLGLIMYVIVVVTVITFFNSKTEKEIDNKEPENKEDQYIEVEIEKDGESKNGRIQN